MRIFDIYFVSMFRESHIYHILILNLSFTEYLELGPRQSDFGHWEKIIMEPFIVSQKPLKDPVAEKMRRPWP